MHRRAGIERELPSYAAVFSACAVDRDGTILLADSRHRRLRRFGPDGRQLGRYGRIATPGPTGLQDLPGILYEPCDVLPLESGMLVACGGLGMEHGVQRLDACGDYQARLDHPLGRWGRAKYFHVKVGNRDGFVEDLEWVVAQDPRQATSPYRWNVYFQSDARLMLERVDRIF